MFSTLSLLLRKKVNTMKLIVGLGNPGEKYRNSRHNVGYMVIDKLKSQISNIKYKIQNSKLIKTNTYMNESGKAVKKQYTKYKIQYTDLYVIHDDLDIRLGSYKIQFGKGPKDHNGLNSIYQSLGTKDFWHVRIGVDNRTSNDRISGEKYVLQDFTQEEKSLLEKILPKLTNELSLVVKK